MVLKERSGGNAPRDSYRVAFWAACRKRLLPCRKKRKEPTVEGERRSGSNDAGTTGGRKW